MIFNQILIEPTNNICDTPLLGKLTKKCLDKEVLCKRLAVIWSVAWYNKGQEIHKLWISYGASKGIIQ